MLLIDHHSLKKLPSQALRKYRRSAFCLTLLLAVCGLLCLLFPLSAGVALSYAAGILLIICGIYTLMLSCTFKKNGKITVFFMIVLGIAYSGIGVCVFLTPVLGINILSAAICFLFLLAGISRTSAALKNPLMIGRYLCLFIGLMDLVIAIIWIGANEYTTYTLVSIFIGLELITHSCIYFTLNNRLSKRCDIR